MCNCTTCEHAKYDILAYMQIYNMYKWLLDSYVLDFYVNEHWSHLPSSWKIYFENMTPSDIGSLLNPSVTLNRTPNISPLEILCLKKLFQNLIISRSNICIKKLYKKPMKHTIYSSLNEDEKLESVLYDNDDILLNHPRLKNSFWKRISPKKKHEITVMAQICSIVARHSDCDIVLDFGSGLGHLSRILAYGYGLRVCCLEAQESLSKEAQKLDSQFEVTASKHLSTNKMKQLRKPVHINMTIKNTIDMNELVQLVKSSLKLKDDDFKFGVIGLHPCGDLAAVLLRFFKEQENVKFINVASCCYMKLSTEQRNSGYPLSKFLIKRDHGLSYNSRELACHAIELYVERLNNGEYIELKTHAFRALIEKIIVKYWPERSHTGLRNVKCNKDMSFDQYCTKAINGLNFPIPQHEFKSENIINYLKNWKNVVTYYSLRLMFAPMIETIILLDRFLYIAESEAECALIPMFDPKLSPRNHILIASKNNK